MFAVLAHHLEVGVAMVGAGRVDAVLVGDDFPKFGTDLVAALAGLDTYKLTHGFGIEICTRAKWVRWRAFLEKRTGAADSPCECAYEDAIAGASQTQGRHPPSAQGRGAAIGYDVQQSSSPFWWKLFCLAP